MNIKRHIPFLGLILATLVVGGFLAHPALAAPIDFFQNFTPENAGFTSGPSVTVIIARLIRTFISVLGVIAVLLILYGGFLYMTAGGETDRLKKAKQVLTNAIIGLVIILSSFAITQFILSRLVEAGGGNINDPAFCLKNPNDASCAGKTFPPPVAKFYLHPVNIACAKTLRNFQLQFIFSKSLPTPDKSGWQGITIKEQSGADAKGTWNVIGNKATFTPKDPCPDPNGAFFCFAKDTTYAVVVDATILKSAEGDALTCQTTNKLTGVIENTCKFGFTTGSGIDTTPPTIAMYSPKDGNNVSIGQIVELQAQTQDDTGVSLVDFYAVDDSAPIYSSGLSWSDKNALTGANVSNIFKTDKDEQWDVSGYVTNKSYPVWAVASDCTGQTATAKKISLIVHAANCDNQIIDDKAPYGETGLNCGGDTTSQYYCGKCKGEVCAANSECSSGFCVDGKCVDVTTIESVSPNNGAVGNLVTITGKGFGEKPGSVDFLGTEKGSSPKNVGAAQCSNGKIQWTAKEIVVPIPDGAEDGPIRVNVPDDATTKPPTLATADRTDDDNGPFMAKFDVNKIKRPGLCALDPNSANVNTAIKLQGLSFGDKQGSGTVYFDNFPASSYPTNSWKNTQISAVVPNLNADKYNAHVFTGDYYCLDSKQQTTTKLCFTNADCAEKDGEICGISWCSETLKYCSTNNACGSGEGNCVDVRVGSNTKKFNATTLAVDALPKISSIDTGWKACSNDAKKKCATKDDCANNGTCLDTKNWGPPGQYVTIFGSNFGTEKGYVKFVSTTSGVVTNADVDFPPACGKNSFWHDDSVIVKVPKSFVEKKEAGVYKVSVVTHTPLESNADDFIVLDDKPGPSICNINPTVGPESTPVKIIGENFGTQKGNIIFNPNVSPDMDKVIWGTENNDVAPAEKISGILVPKGAKTGPVYLTSGKDQSNSVNFQVGNCQTDKTIICSAGTQCCANGSCSNSCPSEDFKAHFAYKISTGKIPIAPEVISQCSDKIISPSPSPLWSKQENVCLNAVVLAQFKGSILTSSLNNENIIVQNCSKETNGICDKWEAVQVEKIDANAKGFAWYSKKEFTENTLYQVTLKGKAALGGGIKSADGASMENDYIWQFKTANAKYYCEVGSVLVNPNVFTAIVPEQNVPYTANLISKNDACVLMSSSTAVIDWDANFSGVKFLNSDDNTNVAKITSKPGVLSQTVIAKEETGDPAHIVATVANTPSKPFGTGLLTVKFADLAITDYFPKCQSACVNVMPWVVFEPGVVNIVAPQFKLFKCANSLCDVNPILGMNELTAQGENTKENPHKVSLNINQNLNPDSLYRVIVSGNVQTIYGLLLGKAGSNYGTPENKFYPKDFSWMFKTKVSDISCDIDHVNVFPKSVTVTHVGDRQEYNATAIGAPDECSITGQTLQTSGYTWSAWVAKEDSKNNDSKNSATTAFLMNNGSIKLTDLPIWCTGQCLNAGSAVKLGQSICGNGKIEKGESCDDGNIKESDGCSSVCLLEGISPTCGNGKIENGELCDDGNKNNGDGCSSLCLNEGATSIGSVCGNNVVDYSAKAGGEDCDDGNAKNNDGCSSDCKWEGSVSVANIYSTCGDGKVEKGKGEDCDGGAGCSAGCLKTGTPECTSGNQVNCCGNGVIDPGEDDDKGKVGAEWLSAKCLFIGASALYKNALPSFCGDGDWGTGETCETINVNALKAGGYGVAQVSDTAPQRVSKETGYAISNLSVIVGGKIGDANLKLQCSCQSDQACGDTKVYGCGEAKCCFDRPKILEISPQNNEKDLCRNTAVSVKFDSEMDTNSFGAGSTDKNNDGKISAEEYDPNVQLELVKLAGVLVTANNCPAEYVKLALNIDSNKNAFVRVWHLAKRIVLGWLGKSAFATPEFKCLAPVTYEVVKDGVKGVVYVRYNNALMANADYKLTIKTDANAGDANTEGVLSKNHVSVVCFKKTDGTEDCSTKPKSSAFKTGNDICTLDKVEATDTGKIGIQEFESPSSGFYSTTGEVHAFGAKPLAYRSSKSSYEIISPISVYKWDWLWSSSIADSDTKSDVVKPAENSQVNVTSAQFVASGNNGKENVIATATISADTISKKSTVGQTTNGIVEETAFLCENPWPGIGKVPFKEISKNTNYSFFYCRDKGASGQCVGGGNDGKDCETSEQCKNKTGDGVCQKNTNDDLPPLESPIDTKSLDPNLIKELVFRVAGTKDAIGVRVMKNPKYLSPSAWFKAQGFTGTPTPATLDGYQAVKSGNTIYVAAANRNFDTLYSNMYIISSNEDAGSTAKEIFNAILGNFRLNANSACDNNVTDCVTDVNLCRNPNKYLTNEKKEYISCLKDQDCVDYCAKDGSCFITGNVCQQDSECTGSTPLTYCDAEKSKLTRNTKRLTDITDMISLFDVYGNAHKHCSITKNKSCFQDSDCSGTETCVSGYPTIQSGTFIPSMSNSIWASWQSALGNALGAALPTDPINQFWGQCKNQGAGYDSTSCWNGTAGKFVCPSGSHLYGYNNNGGEDYTLSAQLEYTNKAFWNDPIDVSKIDHVTVQALYSNINVPSGVLDGFKQIVPQPVGVLSCNGTSFGISTICGDGVKGTGEICEKGEMQAVPCSIPIAGSKPAQSGQINQTCNSTCTGFESGGAVCIPLQCGNGVKDSGEQCDDGALNGTYGHCDKNCQTTNAYYCGDGYLAGSEQCDCGTPQNFSSLASDSWAKTNGCIVANGQYSSDIAFSCTYDCKKPGPACGDKVIQNADGEECDYGMAGGVEDYGGKLCNDNVTKCKVDSDCQKVGGSCSTSACGKAKICIKSDNSTKLNQICNDDNDCVTNGKCSNELYDLVRSNQCSASSQQDACKWEGFTNCHGSGQFCGNGKTEGTEECDDGNTSNFDACTTICKKNVCGDNFVNVGIESCDSGDKNSIDGKEACKSAPYGGACNFCNQFCQYKTQSGAYCGDEVINGNEYCDGNTIPFNCFKSVAGTQKSEVQGVCSSQDAGKTGGKQPAQTWIGTECPKDFTCRKVGSCNGGSLYGESGKACILYGVGGATETQNVNNCDGYCINKDSLGIKVTCNHDSPDCTNFGGKCIGAGTCVAPVCGSDCKSSCPTSFKKEVVQIQSEVDGSTPATSIDLYSFNNPEKNTPEKASLLLPACSVGTGLTADVDTTTTTTSIDVVIVLDISAYMGAMGIPGPPGSPTRLQVAKDSINDFIDELFDNTMKLGVNARIGFVDVDQKAATIKSNFVGFEKEEALKNTVKNEIKTTWDVSLGGGIDKALVMLKSSTAGAKLIVTYTAGFNQYNRNFKKATSYADATKEVFDNILPLNKDVKFYAVGIGLNETNFEKNIARIQHHTSENCANIGMENLCISGIYAFVANSVYEAKALVESIIKPLSGSGANITMSFQDELQKLQPISSSVLIGNNVSLPFSNEFVCSGIKQTVPIYVNNLGTNTTTIKNVMYSYCPK